LEKNTLKTHPQAKNKNNYPIAIDALHNDCDFETKIGMIRE